MPERQKYTKQKKKRNRRKAVPQVADYSSEEKARLLKRIHWLFIAGLAGFVTFFIIYFTGKDGSPVYDFIAGVGLGIAFGMIVFGVIFTGRYAARIREYKLRLLRKSRPM